MATVFIGNLAVTLPSRFFAGDTLLSDIPVRVLNDIHHRRIKARLRYLLSKGDITPQELQAKALVIAAEDLVPYLTLDDDDSVDPVLDEALSIARELIISRMAKEGLPPPKGLDAHAKALVDAMPAIQDRARFRIEARYRAATQALAEI